MPVRRPVIVAVVSVFAAGALVLTAGPASAHVTIADEAEPGGFETVSLTVPNERDDASTTTLEVKLPEEEVLPYVSVQVKPGWTSEVTMRDLDEPIELFGSEVTEVVDTITWTGGEVSPEQFDTFSFRAGPIPEGVDELVFPAVQTYDSGEEVAWVELTEEGAEEPERPAPVLRIVAASATGDVAEAAIDGEEVASTSEADDDTDPVSIAALVIAIAAAALGLGAFLRSKRPATT